MNKLQVTGRQNFMGKDIPVVLGGFGAGKKCISDKTIAEIHGMRTPDVRRRIADNINRFSENVDYIDLMKGVRQTHDVTICSQIGYASAEISKSEHIYILSERGYAKLIKIMDTDLAWVIHDKLIDEYFELREQTARQEFNPASDCAVLRSLRQKTKEKLIEPQQQNRPVMIGRFWHLVEICRYPAFPTAGMSVVGVYNYFVAT